MAGLAAAIELRTTTGLEVVVAEARQAPLARFGETVAPGVLAALDRLGLAARFRAAGHLACPGGLAAWGDGKPRHNDFLLEPMGPAWHIDRPRLESLLRTRADEVGAQVLVGACPVTVKPVRDRFDAVLTSEHGLTARQPRWVVDATGHRSWFARRRGARSISHDRMVAMVRIAELATGTFTAQTVVESAPEGWWYGVRLPGARLVTALVTDAEHVPRLLGNGWADWHQALSTTEVLAPQLAVGTVRDARFTVWPVRVGILDQVQGERWLAIGDAACLLDPVTGRGILEALGDAADGARWVAAEAGLRSAPSWSYSERIRGRFGDHLSTRDDWYAREQRWPTSTFWTARAAVRTPGN